MRLILYNNHSENNKLDKTIVKVIELTGYLRESTSLINPSIVVELNPENLNVQYVVDNNQVFVNYNGDLVEWDSYVYNYVLSANYCYIPDFNRYYYIEDIISVRNNLWQLIMRVDVLMSWKKEIYQQKGFVSRTHGTSRNANLVDDLLPLKDVPVVSYYTPKNRTGSSVIELDYDMDTDEETLNLLPNVLYSAVTKVVDIPSLTDKVTPPDSGLPTIQNRRSPNVTHRLLTLAEYGSILSACIDNDAPASFITSILLMPFNLKEVFTDVGTKTAKVYAGDKVLELGATWGNLSSSNVIEVYATGKGSSPYIVIADFYFDERGEIEISESFIEFTKSSLWECYIPFVGWVQIEPVNIYGKRILIYYTFDLDTGLSTAYIYNATDQQVIWSGSCQIGMRLPLATTNAEELARQEQATGLNIAMGLISSALSIGIGAYSGNAVAVVGGVMGGAKTITSAVNSFNSMIEKAQTTFGSSDNALYSPNKVYVRKTTHTSLIDESDTQFSKLYGLPYRKIVKLEELKGDNFTIVSDIHLEGFAGSLRGELDEIESLLHEGVIL